VDVTIELDASRRGTTVRAEAGQYDGHPLFPSVTVSGAPFSLHPDREAVAAGLIFHESVAGALTLGRGCSPLMASALRKFFEPIDLHVLSIDFEPSRINMGDSTLHVVVEGVNERSSPRTDGNDVVFVVKKEGAGMLATSREVGVVSNAVLVPAPGDVPIKRMLPALGVAVLFAEDLFVSRVSLPGLEDAVFTEHWRRLGSLLDAAGLKLVTP